MYLRRLEVHGFKSFAKKTVLEFEPGITSIVGPNGAGKSNIADALRWVFGEQSMKLLRSKKAEDVIFAGSDQKARLGSCEVQVTIDNSDHIMPLDYEEVVIARRMYRDGNSDYLINGSAVRLLDIEETMAKSGFAHSSYHVIGQGMIDSLILGGPAAIKELLEEASGVKPYYLKRDSALRKLERTSENLRQVEALLQEIEPRLRSLRRQTRRYERRAEIETRLRQLQTQYYRGVFAGADQQESAAAAKVQTFEKEIEKHKQEIAKLKKEIEAQERETEGRSETYRKLRTDIDALHKQKLKLQEEQAEWRGKLKAEAAAAASFIPNWAEIKKKFHHAYEALQSLLKNFTPDGARQVEKLFNEFQIELEGSPPRLSSPTEGGEKRLKELESDLAKLISQIQKLETDLNRYTQSETDAKQQLFVKERLLRARQDGLLKLNEQKNQLAVEQARIQTRLENFEQEARAALGPEFRKLIQDTPASSPDNLLEEIAKLQKQLEMIGGVDELLLQEYKETEERYQYLTTQSADLKKGVDDLQKIIAELDETIKKDFQAAFAKISEKFAEYFRILFGGGKATMNLLRERRDLPFNSPPHEEGKGEVINSGEEMQPPAKSEITGIDIRATPPGKKLAGIAALSGGERALTAIALLSSILACFPSPFVVLDEVDAALDEANSIRFGKIVGSLANKTQFITITHNRETMRQSHTLYGVTMGDDGVSKILSLKLSEAAVYSTKN